MTRNNAYHKQPSPQQQPAVHSIIPAHSYSHVLAQSNSPGYSTSLTSVNSPPEYTNPIPNSITFPIHTNSAFEKSSISNAVISVLIATVKNNEVPGTFEAVLNSLPVANGLPQSKMGNVTPSSSFPSTSTDSVSLNTQSTSPISPSLPDKPSTASTDDHSATIYKTKKCRKPTKENLSVLISENRLILKPPLRIEEVIKQFNSLKNNIEVVNLSAAEFDRMLISDKDTKDNNGIR